MARFIAAATLQMTVLLFLATASSPALAHVPHDIVDVIQLSPAYARDQTVFTSVRHNLLRSQDGGFTWRRLTLGLGPHVFTSLAVSPSFDIDETLFLGTYDGGVYRSQDGGLSWVQCNRGLTDIHVALVEVSPDFESDGSVLVATYDGDLHLTEDGGENWERIFQEPPIVQRPTNDEIRNFLGFFRTQGITSLRFAKEAIVLGTASGEVRISRDRGATWSSFRLPTPQRITSIEVPRGSSADGFFLVGTELEGVVRVLGWGASFEHAGGAVSGVHVTSLNSSRDAGGNLVLFATAWNDATFRSVDEGRTWTKHAEGLTKDSQAERPGDRFPHFLGIAVSEGFSSDSTVFVGGFDGLFKSTDAGVSWRELETLPIGLIVGLDVSPATDSGFSVGVTTYSAGIYSKTEQSESWTIDYSDALKWRLSAIAYSPNYADDGVLFVTGTGGSVFKSNGERHWTEARIPRKLTDKLYRIAQLRLESVSSWLRSSPARDTSSWDWNIHPAPLAISPDFGEDGTVFVGTRAHGLFRSLDGGSSFSLVWEPPGMRPFSLVVSPRFSSDRTAFATAADGVYRSRDGGVRWQRVGSGDEFGQANLAVSPDYPTDHTLFAGGRRGLFRSRDGGETWQRLTIDPADAEGAIDGIALSPNFGVEPHVLVRTTGRGLVRSRDGGETFERLGDGPSGHSYAFSVMADFTEREWAPLIKFSPNYQSDRTVYASSMMHLLKSTDTGSTWELVPRPVRYESAHLRGDVWVSRFAAKGLWRILDGAEFTRSMTSWADWPGDEARLTFVGTGIRWIGARGPDHGMAEVFIDGVARTRVDQYAGARESGVVSFSETELAWGPHTLTIEIAEARNEAASGSRVEIDAIDVLGYR